jgi:hypothetical protein
LTSVGIVIRANQALRALVPDMVAALTDQLKEKSIKVRITVFQLLKQVIGVVDNALVGFGGSFVPGIAFCLTDKSANSNLRTEALLFLRLLLETQPATEFQPHFAEISVPVYAAVNDTFYKITAEALRVCTAFVPVLRASVGIELRVLLLSCNCT